MSVYIKIVVGIVIWMTVMIEKSISISGEYESERGGETLFIGELCLKEDVFLFLNFLIGCMISLLSNLKLFPFSFSFFMYKVA